MSTEHAHEHEHDNEYGPTPAGAAYEHTDIDPGIGYKFALWLTVAMFISFGIVYGTFVFFDSRQHAADSAAQRYPLAGTAQRDNPTPFLQTQPFKDIYMLRSEEEKKLTTYGWVDKEGGVTRLPINRAMELMIQRGVPTSAGSADTLNVVTQDSSSGRTVVPR
jgi:hypothetical protein